MMRKNKILEMALLTAGAACLCFAFSGGMTAKAEVAVNASEYGAYPNDGVDDTEQINKAIREVSEAGGGIVTIDAGEFNISTPVQIGIELKDNVTINMAANTVLRLKANSKNYYDYIAIKNAHNVTINGGKIYADKKQHVGESEDCHAICIKDSQNVKLENVKIYDAVTDGIYLGTMNDSDNLYGCSKITIKKCTVSNSGRNNIGIVDADNVTIDGCTIKKAKGKAPQCGILIEPTTNGGKVIKDQICSNITIKNTKITCVKKGDRNGQFFAIMILNPYYYAGKNNVVAKKVTIDKCTLGGDAGNYSGQKVTLKNTTVKGTFYDHKGTKLKKCKVGKLYRF
jgi:polygalacturonase